MTDENGTAKLPINCKFGKYNITIIYKDTIKTDTITVKATNINIDIKDVLVGEMK